MTATASSLTRNQQLVLETLSGSGMPMSAYSILDSLREDGFRAPPQVYRALDKLVETGRVHKLETLNAFVACAHEQCHKAGLIAFAICESCGQVSEFSDKMVSQGLAAWSDKHGFKRSKTTLEIRGDCGACVEASA